MGSKRDDVFSWREMKLVMKLASPANDDQARESLACVSSSETDTMSLPLSSTQMHAAGQQLGSRNERKRKRERDVRNRGKRCTGKRRRRTACEAA